jgi:parvulin-like peptidyl-prolyl isomerase
VCAPAVCAPAVWADEPTEWAARHILVAYKGAERAQPAVTRTKEEAKALAAKVAAEAAAEGADFAALSTTYSDDKFAASQGGFLGFFERGAMTPAFQDAVEKLKPGQVSGVVETPFGFHIVQRLDLEQASDLVARTRATVVIAFFPWKEVARDPKVTRAKELALSDATKAAAELKSGVAMADLPEVLGAAPAAPGFQSQVLQRGGVRPEFKILEDTAFTLPVGDVSAPLETPVGYALVQRRAFFRMRVEHLVVLYKGGAAADPTVTRTKEQAKARAEEALAKFVADPSAWKKIVGEYSEEPGAGERSGSLGVAEPGKFVPAFDAAIADLKVGEHTKVFETPFGYHVARRVP